MASSSRLLSRGAIVVVGGGLYGLAAYYTYHAFRPCEHTKAQTDNGRSDKTLPSGTERAEQFTRIAKCYDSAIGNDEFFMGMNLLRRFLLSNHSRGTVLEIGAGTGRNISYYGRKVKRVMLVDQSAKMCEEAQEKITQRAQGKDGGPRFIVKQGDASHLSFCPSQSFDTVVDTFGLCSYDDPVKVLREMVRVCKPNGSILLLEHGRSKTWTWVTQHLDRYQADHAQKWGCIWNRDLDELLEKVEDVLEVKSLNHYHFGTTYYVICRPKAMEEKIKEHDNQTQ